MRFDKISIRGVGPFRELSELDLTQIDGSLIAVVGANGEGKSCLLELFAGAMYRRCPTRGSLVDLATSRDAFVEARVVNGSPWTLRHTMDCVSGKSEALVLGDDGAPAFASTKVRDFDNWAAKTLPSEDVLYASTVAAQGSGGFLEMKAGDRKALLLRLLGIEELERLAGMAREHARAAKAAVDVSEARLREARASGVDVATATTDCAAALEAQISALKASDAAREALKAAEAQADVARAAIAAENERQRRSGELQGKHLAALARVADLEGRIANNRGVMARADAIRHAQRVVIALDADMRSLNIDVARLTETVRAADAEYSDKLRRENDAQRALHESQRRADDLAKRAADGALVARAAESLPARHAELEDTEQRVADLDKLIESLQEASAGVADRRIGRLRDGLKAIRDECEDARYGLEETRTVASDAIASDDSMAAAASTAPAKLRKAQEDVRPLRQHVANQRVVLNEAERTAALAPAIEQAKADLAAAHEQAKALQAAWETAVAAVNAAHQARNEALAALGAAKNRLDEAGAKRKAAEADPDFLLIDRLATAEARLAELQPQLNAATTEAREAEEQVLGLHAAAPAQMPAMPDVDGARSAMTKADRAAAYADSELRAAEKTLEDAKARAVRLENLQVEQATAAEELADWTRLAEDLGRDGLQAAIVDNAAPELTALTNDLLNGAFGPRFSVRFDTQRASSDGKKELEVFDVSIIDTERGRDALAETLSGGERVVVSEAIRMALTAMVCRQNGIDGPDLIRDETGAALDSKNARAYVAMLRRAASMIGARHILFVSHSPDVQELADARVNVRDGRIEVAA